MKTYKITFTDTIKANTEEDAYGDQDSLLIDQCKAALAKAERGAE